MTAGPAKGRVPAVPDGGAPPAATGQFVVVVPEVVDSIGHVLGNLFQRLYHLVEVARTDGAGAAEDLTTTTRHLEGFLRTALDYLCPTTLTYQDLSIEDVVDGWRHQIGEAGGWGVRTEVEPRRPGVLRVDPAALRRSFALIATRLSRCADGGVVRLRIATAPGDRAVAVSALLPPGAVDVGSSEREVEWALAEKLIELQGGTLREVRHGAGGTTWEIVLPVQS